MHAAGWTISLAEMETLVVYDIISQDIGNIR